MEESSSVRGIIIDPFPVIGFQVHYQGVVNPGFFSGVTGSITYEPGRGFVRCIMVISVKILIILIYGIFSSLSW